MIAGPLLGALIGYFTNFIAVKMLFYPKKEIRIFGRRLPFTPGAIPKGKDRLAKAIGKVVGETLITKEAITDKLLNEENSSMILRTVENQMEKPLREELLLLFDSSEETYDKRREDLIDIVSRKLAEAISGIEVTDEMIGKCASAVRDRIKMPIKQLFLSEDKLRLRIGDYIHDFLEEFGENGVTYIRPVMEKKVSDAEDHSCRELSSAIGITEDDVHLILLSAYRKLVLTGTEKLISTIDIADIVKTRIDEMDVGDLEKMVLEVMKKELNTIVNLGALIGFLIGLLNILL